MTRQQLWFVLHLNPEPWAIGPVGVGRRNGHLYAYVGQNQQLASFQEAVREEVKGMLPEGFAMLEGELEITVFFWRNLQGTKHQADATNMQKAIEDALQGVVFANDRNVRAVHTYTVDQAPDTEPMIVVGVNNNGFPLASLNLIPADVAVRMLTRVPPTTGVEESGWEAPEGMF